MLNNSTPGVEKTIIKFWLRITNGNRLILIKKQSFPDGYADIISRQRLSVKLLNQFSFYLIR